MHNSRHVKPRSRLSLHLLAAVLAVTAPSGLAFANAPFSNIKDPLADFDFVEDVGVPVGLVFAGAVPIALTVLSSVASKRNHRIASTLAIFESVAGAAAIAGGGFAIQHGRTIGHFPLVTGLLALGHGTFALISGDAAEPSPVDISIPASRRGGSLRLDGNF